MYVKVCVFQIYGRKPVSAPVGRLVCCTTSGGMAFHGFEAAQPCSVLLFLMLLLNVVVTLERGLDAMPENIFINHVSGGR